MFTRLKVAWFALQDMKLFPAHALFVSRDGDNKPFVEGHKPFVTLVSARGLSVVGQADLRALGYRRVARKPHFFPSTYYARPWLLWALLKTAYTAREACWCVVWWLYQHGVFHLAAEESADFRWRDVRPGPERRVCLSPESITPLTQAEIEQEMAAIQARFEECRRTDPIGLLGAMRLMAADESFDEQTRSLARTVIEELEKPTEDVGPNG